MTDDDFMNFELELIPFEELDKYSPNDFQREYLTTLHNGDLFSSNLRINLLNLYRKYKVYADNESIPEGEGLSILYSRQHIITIMDILIVKHCSERNFISDTDKLVLFMHPAFEVVKGRTTQYDDYYKSDFRTRWITAANACNWEGVYNNYRRFVALRNSPIWQKLSEADDGLYPYPPFYLNGGWAFTWRLIDRKEAEKLGFVLPKKFNL